MNSFLSYGIVAIVSVPRQSFRCFGGMISQSRTPGAPKAGGDNDNIRKKRSAVGQRNWKTKHYLERSMNQERLRRVVSEPDEMMADATDDYDTADMPARGMVRQHNAATNDLLSKPPKAPFAIIENHHADDEDSSSTLSNESNDDTPLVQFTSPRPAEFTQYQRLPRTNSRSSTSSSQMAPSSQTSSRDWGWFEDVHVTDRKLKGSNHKDENASGNVKRKAKNSNTMVDENGTNSR